MDGGRRNRDNVTRLLRVFASLFPSPFRPHFPSQLQSLEFTRPASGDVLISPSLLRRAGGLQINLGRDSSQGRLAMAAFLQGGDLDVAALVITAAELMTMMMKTIPRGRMDERAGGKGVPGLLSLPPSLHQISLINLVCVHRAASAPSFLRGVTILSSYRDLSSICCTVVYFADALRNRLRDFVMAEGEITLHIV